MGKVEDGREENQIFQHASQTRIVLAIARVLLHALLRVTCETTGAAPVHLRHCLIFFFFCGIMDGTRALWTRALCMLGRYSPTELYPQLLSSLDNIQHLIDKDQRKEMPFFLNFSNPGVAFHFYPFAQFLWPTRQSFFFPPITFLIYDKTWPEGTYRKMSLFGLMVLKGESITASGGLASCSRCGERRRGLRDHIFTRKHQAERRLDVRWGCEFSKPIPSDVFPPARLHISPRSTTSWEP